MTQPDDDTPTKPPSTPEDMPPEDARNLAMLAHILNFMLLGPLLIYLLRKDSDPFLDDQVKEALNFSISCLLIHVACQVLHFLCLPILVSLALLVVQIVLGITGGLKAREGMAYHYPFNFKFIK